MMLTKDIKFINKIYSDVLAQISTKDKRLREDPRNS
jgi:hypothetical protein